MMDLYKGYREELVLMELHTTNLLLSYIVAGIRPSDEELAEISGVLNSMKKQLDVLCDHKSMEDTP